jgi:hypothetical protein
MDDYRRRPPMEGFSRPGQPGGEAIDDDAVEGHIMDDRDDTIGDTSLKRRRLDEDDTEGHRRKRLDDEDDTEGHATKRRLDDEDDTEGHATKRRLDDEDDTEGHSLKKLS